MIYHSVWYITVVHITGMLYHIVYTIHICDITVAYHMCDITYVI